MKIIDGMPIAEKGWRVPTPDGDEDVLPYQMIVRVSITAADIRECPADAPMIPVVVDTGNNHNYAMRRAHWDRWIRWTPRRIGQILVGGTFVPLFAAKLWIHPNRAGADELSGGVPRALDMDQGIAIYPSTMKNPARLPILGLRGLIRNRIKFTMDGPTRSLTLEAPTA